MIIIIDASSTNSEPRTIELARDAAAVAIACLPEDVRFGVLAGSAVARRIYPTTDQLVVSTIEHRREAREAVDTLVVGGAGAVAGCLTLADEWFDSGRFSVRHAILLSDGRAGGDTEAELNQVLRRCRGRFRCDCRGWGEDGQMDELGTISRVLSGTTERLPSHGATAADFTELVNGDAGIDIGRVALRLWLASGASIGSVAQVAPTASDLTSRGVPVGDRHTDYPTDPWRAESRHYRLRIRVPHGEAGDDMRAARVSVVVDGVAQGPTNLLAIWPSPEEEETSNVPRRPIDPPDDGDEPGLDRDSTYPIRRDGRAS